MMAYSRRDSHDLHEPLRYLKYSFDELMGVVCSQWCERMDYFILF